MKTQLLTRLTAICLMLGMGQAWAIPTLQLNIIGGEYDLVDETTVTSSPTFTLQAYLTPGAHDTAELLDKEYYVSMAIVPQDLAAGNYGSFTYNGNTVNVTDDMTYGSAPLDSVDPDLLGMDPGDLAAHGIYETWFIEVAIRFDSAEAYTGAAMNAQDDSGATPGPGTSMYIYDFDIDASNLDMSNTEGLHFDLYSADLAACKGNSKNCVESDVDVTDFAPFSHDAAYVPEPASLALLGLGLLGLGLRRREKQVH